MKLYDPNLCRVFYYHARFIIIKHAVPSPDQAFRQLDWFVKSPDQVGAPEFRDSCNLFDKKSYDELPLQVSDQETRFGKHG